MKELENTPVWVKLLYVNVHSRKVAWIIVLSCVIFSLYCVPWVTFNQAPWVGKVFLLEDWNWFIPMLPMTVWYGVAFNWVDKRNAW